MFFWKFIRRTSFTTATLMIVNPILILLFQNCSLVKLSDLKVAANQKPEIVAPLIKEAK